MLSAVVSVVTKSGGNQFGGSAFYFGRDQRLNAKNAFATTKPPFDQTRLGGSFGGPILKNRTHFFTAGEHLKVNGTAIVALPASNPFAKQDAWVSLEEPSSQRVSFGPAAVSLRTVASDAEAKSAEAPTGTDGWGRFGNRKARSESSARSRSFPSSGAGRPARARSATSRSRLAISAASSTRARSCASIRSARLRGSPC